MVVIVVVIQDREQYVGVYRNRIERREVETRNATQYDTQSEIGSTCVCRDIGADSAPHSL